MPPDMGCCGSAAARSCSGCTAVLASRPRSCFTNALIGFFLRLSSSDARAFGTSGKMPSRSDAVTSLQAILSTPQPSHSENL